MSSVDLKINLNDNDFEQLIQRMNSVEGISEQLYQIATIPGYINCFEGLNATTANIDFIVSNSAKLNQLEKLLGTPASICNSFKITYELKQDWQIKTIQIGIAKWTADDNPPTQTQTDYLYPCVQCEIDTVWKNQGNGSSTCQNCNISVTNSKFKCDCQTLDYIYTKDEKKSCAACHGWIAVEVPIPEIPTTQETFSRVCPKCKFVTQWKNYGKAASCLTCSLVASNYSSPCNECPQINFLYYAPYYPIGQCPQCFMSGDQSVIEVFQDKRINSMLQQLEQKKLTIDDIQQNLTCSSIKIDQEGWRDIISASSELPGYQSISGVHIDTNTGIATLQLRPGERQFSYIHDSDIEFVFQNGIYDTYFTLDHSEAKVEHNPLQTLKYYPKQLENSEYLKTLFHSDYLLKQLLTGVMVSHVWPYNTKNIEQLLQALPDEIKEQLLIPYKFEKPHRFWIESQTIAYKLVEQNQQITVDILDPEMIVRRQQLQWQNGYLIDDVVNSSEDGPEAQFCQNFQYESLGEYFPELRRLQQLNKLSAINSILYQLKIQKKRVEILVLNGKQININFDDNNYQKKSEDLIYSDSSVSPQFNSLDMHMALIFDCWVESTRSAGKLRSVENKKSNQIIMVENSKCSMVPTVFNLKNFNYVYGGVDLKTNLKPMNDQQIQFNQQRKDGKLCDLSKCKDLQKIPINFLTTNFSKEQISNSHDLATHLHTIDKRIQTGYNKKIHGNCGGVLNRINQIGFGMEPHASGIASAKDFGPYQEKLGYVKTPGKTLNQCIPGDIVIYAGNKRHPHGHIQRLCNDMVWRSDYKQNSGNITGTGNVYMVYSRQKKP